MIVGYIGSGRLASATIRRLASSYQVHTFNCGSVELIGVTGVAAEQNFADLARKCDVIIFGSGTSDEIRQTVSPQEKLAEGLSQGKIVIDQTAGYPDQTRALSTWLGANGVTLVDAPIHCELSNEFPDTSAIMFGCAADAVERVRPILETICPKVTFFGDAGNGHAARLVVSAIAACNRLVTYECAAVGLKNGLSVADMSTVLNKSSGQNSGTARLLPILGKNIPSSDLALRDVVQDLRMASKLASKTGAPMLIANLVTDICETLSNQMGPSATYDDTVRVVESAANINFSN